jgi:hypothetical protein
LSVICRPTVVDGFCANDFKFSLDVRIKVLYKIEMVRQLLPLDQVVDTILMSNVAFASDIGQGLGIGMDGCHQ